MNTKTRRTGKQIAAGVISWMFVAITAFFSAAHIFGLGRSGGLAMAEAIALVPMIDGFGVLGRILRSLTRPASRRFGTWMTVIACAVSLAANMAHGHTVGQKLFGLVTVAGFIAAEAAVHAVAKDAAEQGQHTPDRPQITQADVQTAVRTAVDTAVVATLAQAAIDTQAAITAAVAEALAADQKRRDREERNARRRAQRNAPVSPATVAEIESSYPAPVSAYEPAYL